MDRIGYATRKELLKRAKDLNIVGRWDMTKGELIVAITKAMEEREAKKDGTITNPGGYKDTHLPQKATQDYVNNITLGTIVAFKVLLGGKQRVLSAKVNGKDSVGYLLVETKNGSKYRVVPDDVIWVKTGLRWPKWVLEQLKGESSNAN